jgi:hypothetical protein
LARGVPYRTRFNFQKRKQVNAMATVPKLIKASLAFGNATHDQVLGQGYAVLQGLKGNVNFTHLPVDLDVLKTTLDDYSVSIVDSRDGGKKAITLRNQLGETVIRMLRALAAHVELNCKDDMTIFLSSGFQPRANARTPAQPLAQPSIDSIDQGITGQLLVWIKAVSKAKSYELRYGPAGPGGSTPASWTMQTVGNTRLAAPINGLTPGVIYAIQVRAFGQLGHTEWTDSATRMCI